MINHVTFSFCLLISYLSVYAVGGRRDSLTSTSLMINIVHRLVQHEVIRKFNNLESCWPCLVFLVK